MNREDCGSFGSYNSEDRKCIEECRSANECKIKTSEEHISIVKAGCPDCNGEISILHRNGIAVCRLCGYSKSF